MDELTERLSRLWIGLKADKDWQIIDNDLQFVASVAQAIAQPAGPQVELDDGDLCYQLSFHYAQELYDATLRWWQRPDEPAITERANRASGEIWQIVWRYVVVTFRRDEQLAPDIAQSVVLRLLENPTVVDKPESFLSWVRWQVRDFLGRKLYRNDPRSQSLEESRSNDEDETNAAVAEMADEALIQQALALIRQLVSPFQYEVIRLVEFEGMKPHEAAAHLGVPVHRVRVEKSRGLATLRTSGQFDYLREGDFDEQP